MEYTERKAKKKSYSYKKENIPLYKPKCRKKKMMVQIASYISNSLLLMHIRFSPKAVNTAPDLYPLARE